MVYVSTESEKPLSRLPILAVLRGLCNELNIHYYIIILYSSIDDLVIFEKLDGGVLEKNIF